MEKVSILIPVYNGESTIERCVNSCLSQTYENIEIVIVIDGSSDNSLVIADRLKGTDDRILLLNKPNEGLPRTRRVAFELSSGDFIYHLDQDDYLESDAIRILVKKINESKADILVGGSVYERPRGEKITQWISEIEGETKVDYLNAIFESKLQPNIWGKLIRRHIYDIVEVIDKHTGGEDYLANVMMICYNDQLVIKSIPDIVHHYIVHDKSLTSTMPPEEFLEFTDTIEEILITSGLEDSVMESWAYFRIKKCWLYYLRTGGKKYLNNSELLDKLYNRQLNLIKNRLKLGERIELYLFRSNFQVGFIFSRLYFAHNKLLGQIRIFKLNMKLD